MGGWMGGYWNHFIRLSVCSSVHSLFSRSGSLQELIWSNYVNFYRISWTASPFAFKLGLKVHYHKPDWFYGEIGLLCSRSRSQQNFEMSMNVYPHDIFWIVDPFNTKFGIVMHHHEPDSEIVFQKDWFAVCKVKVAVEDNLIKVWLFKVYYLNWWSFCNETWFDDTYLGMVMQYHGPKRHARRLVCCLKVHGHSEGSFELLIFLQPNFIGLYIIISWSALCKN